MSMSMASNLGGSTKPRRHEDAKNGLGIPRRPFVSFLPSWLAPAALLTERRLGRLVTIALLAVLTLALALRVWGIGWGMPYAFHPDEDNYLPGAMRMLVNGDLNPHYFRNPPLLTYTVLLELLAYLQVGRFLGFAQSVTDLGLQMLQSPTPLYILARMNGALLGSATVYVTYLVGRRLFDTRVGLASALLLAVAFLHVRDSHYAVNDVPATLPLMISFYFATRILALPAGSSKCHRASLLHYREYVAGGVFLGLGVATKYNVGVGAVALLAAHLLRFEKTRDAWDLRHHLPLLAAAATSVLVFLAANPYSLLDAPAFLRGFADQYGWTYDPYQTTDTSTSLVILRSLSVGTSPLMLAASAVGLALLAIADRRRLLLLVAFPLVYLAFFLLASDLFYARFAIPVIPFLALAAGYAAVRATAKVRTGFRRYSAAAAIAGLLVLPPLAVDVKHDSLLRAEDTRLELGRWVEANLHPGGKMAVEGYSFVDFWGRRLAPKKIEYELQVLPSLRAHPLDYYRQEGFDYLVASSFVYGRYNLDPAAHAAEIQWYQELDRELPLVATFQPTADGRELPFLMDDETTPLYTVLERNRPGPTIKVYRVRPLPKYGAEWLKADVPAEMPAGQKLMVPVTVRNSGDLPWPGQGYTPVRIAYRWLDAAGRELAGDEAPHTPLPRDLAPGEEVSAQVAVIAPAIPGAYTLRLDLVQENFAWLSSKGAETRDVEINVR